MEVGEGIKMSDSYLVVSVHDVTPKFKSELDEIISGLKGIGVTKQSLLVIPNYERRHNIIDDDGFVSRLHDLKNKGDEIVQHGYEHVSSLRQYDSLPHWFMGEIFAQGCGEFQNIGYDEAKERIEEGRDILQQAGFTPKGFIAPGWLLNNDSEKAVRDAGFSYTTRMNWLHRSNHEDEYSPAMGFAPFPVLDDMARMYDSVLANHYLKDKKLARVVIHPQDVKKKGTFEFALELIKKLMKERELTTYADFVKE